MIKVRQPTTEERILEYAFSSDGSTRKEFNEYCIKYFHTTKEFLISLWNKKLLYVNSWKDTRLTPKGIKRFYELRDLESAQNSEAPL